MPDFMDHVQDQVLVELEAMQARRLARVPVPPALGTVLFCAHCGEVIDPRRVRAVPGVCTCVQCQSLHERRGGLR